jgi:DUF1365 family protein
MHISPFFPMEIEHEFTIGAPGSDIYVKVENLSEGRSLFTASLQLSAYPADRYHMHRIIWRYPFMTSRVSLGIYLQALALRLKGATFHHHPGRARSGPGEAATTPVRAGVKGRAGR